MSQKERIIDEAMQLFLSFGIKAVRMDDIAQHLGMSKRTLYEMFADKEELLYLAMNHYFERKEARYFELTAGAANILEAMFMVLDDVMDNSETDNRLMANAKKFYPAIHERLLNEGGEKRHQSFKMNIKKGIADGLFTKNFDIELAMSILYYTISALIVRKELIIPAGISEREAFIQIVSTFFRGIATEKGMKLIDNYLEIHGSEKQTNNSSL